jgi:hypothetical protein
MLRFFFYIRRNRCVFPFLTLFALVASTSKVFVKFSAGCISLMELSLVSSILNVHA